MKTLKPTKKEREIIAKFREIEALMAECPNVKLMCGDMCALLRARPDTGDVIAPEGDPFAGNVDQSRILATFDIWNDGFGGGG